MLKTAKEFQFVVFFILTEIVWEEIFFSCTHTKN